MNTNAAAGDTIVYLPYHSESISSAVVLAHAGLSLVGEGTGAAVPRFTAAGAVAMFDLTGAGILLDNLYFPPSSAVPTARVRVGAAGASLNALQFDCGTNDTNQSLGFISGASNASVRNTRFTSVGAQPAIAWEVSSNVTDLAVDNVTFDGGSFGWSTYAWRLDATVTRLRAKRIYQFNGSNILITTGTSGTLNVISATGADRVDWTP